MTPSSIKPDSREMIGGQLKVLVLVLFMAACLRLWGAFENPNYFEDEPLHVPSAISLGTYGTTTSMSWIHPPLSGLILYGTINLFGNTPYGWRSANVFFGTASVLLMYLIGLRLYPGGSIPIIASSLLALDPFHAYFSRTTFMEVPASFFFLLYLYFMVEYSERGRRTLPLAGIALGLTMATKAYFVLAIPLVAGYAFYRAQQDGNRITVLCADFGVTLVLLPAAVLLLSYFQWFGRGYTLPEFVQMNFDAIRTLQSYKAEEFLNRSYIEAGGKPWEWFLKPLIFGAQQLLPDEDKGRFLLEINNPPFRLLVIPSLLAICIHAWKKRAVRELLVPLLFASCYLLFLLVRRPMFSYSALVVLPFAYLAVAHAVELFARWCGRERPVRACFLCAVAAWGLYVFPLISARLVPLCLYRPLLGIAKIVERF